MCSSRRDIQSYSNDLFQKLPDDLIVFILTKLSCSTSDNDDNYNSLDNIKLLGWCSSISKHFNSLVPLVPSLSINHPSVYMLCHLIPNKFKHIRALQITHWPRTAALMRDQDKCIPMIIWQASYIPHSYFLAVVSYKNIFSYIFKDPKSFKHLDATLKDDKYYESIWSDIKDRFCLHHMLVSSIMEHAFLQRVVLLFLIDGGL